MKLAKKIFNKVTAGLSGLALIATVGSCDVAFDASKKIDPPGIYECKPKGGHQGSTYKFDSTDERTLVWFGSNPGIEFYDQNSKEVVRLYENSNVKYDCDCTQPQK